MRFTEAKKMHWKRSCNGGKSWMYKEENFYNKNESWALLNKDGLFNKAYSLKKKPFPA